MSKKKTLLIFIAGIFTMFLGNVLSAKENSIVLNDPVTNDVDHTFKYPNFVISNDIRPYSITLSIENGYFNTNNLELNNAVTTYFDFRGGTNTTNAYVSFLSTEENYKVITFNLKNSVDLTNITINKNVISSIQNFLRNILFYNENNKDAKFTLTFSEMELKFSNVENNLENIDVIAFKDPNQPKEHYYAKIEDPFITWTDAYNIASSLKFNNLQGYLVTITSEEEHNFIYQSLGSIEGWMGAASIKNYEDINYNTKNIIWDPATDSLAYSKGYKQNNDNDKLIRIYWRWVAGPEAGQPVFSENSYTNFNDGEPNNYSVGEWCAEYGFGPGGKWNDYPLDASAIDGYYIEFGGFEDDEESVSPVSLVSTFRWKDYDFRNIEKEIEEALNSAVFDENVTEQDIQKIIDAAIEETEVSEATSTVKNKIINNTSLNFDIEIYIGEGDQKVTYGLHVNMNLIGDNLQTERKVIITEINDTQLQTEELVSENPATNDNILIYISLIIIFVIGIIGNTIILSKKVLIK